MIITRLVKSYYSFRDYSELTYLEVRKLAETYQTPSYTPSLKKQLKECLNEIINSHRKKLNKFSSKPMSLKKSEEIYCDD